MADSRKNAVYRRLELDELVSKMEQIEEQAALTLDEYPNGHTLERQRLIAAIAKQVRSHLVDQLRAGDREPLDGEAKRIRVVAMAEEQEGVPGSSD